MEGKMTEILLAGLVAGAFGAFGWLLHHHLTNIKERLDRQEHMVQELLDRLGKRFEDCVKHFASQQDVQQLRQHVDTTVGNASCNLLRR